VAGTRAWQVALGTGAGSAWDPWVVLLVVFAAVYLAVGVVLFGQLQESA
jgi:hypothetical protein